MDPDSPRTCRIRHGKIGTSSRPEVCAAVRHLPALASSRVRSTRPGQTQPEAQQTRTCANSLCTGPLYDILRTVGSPSVGALHSSASLPLLWGRHRRCVRALSLHPFDRDGTRVSSTIDPPRKHSKSDKVKPPRQTHLFSDEQVLRKTLYPIFICLHTLTLFYQIDKTGLPTTLKKGQKVVKLENWLSRLRNCTGKRFSLQNLYYNCRRRFYSFH